VYGRKEENAVLYFGLFYTFLESCRNPVVPFYSLSDQFDKPFTSDTIFRGFHRDCRNQVGSFHIFLDRIHNLLPSSERCAHTGQVENCNLLNGYPLFNFTAVICPKEEVRQKNVPKIATGFAPRGLGRHFV